MGQFSMSSFTVTMSWLNFLAWLRWGHVPPLVLLAGLPLPGTHLPGILCGIRSVLHHPLWWASLKPTPFSGLQFHPAIGWPSYGQQPKRTWWTQIGVMSRDWRLCWARRDVHGGTTLWVVGSWTFFYYGFVFNLQPHLCGVSDPCMGSAWANLVDPSPALQLLSCVAPFKAVLGASTPAAHPDPVSLTISSMVPMEGTTVLGPTVWSLV